MQSALNYKLLVSKPGFPVFATYWFLEKLATCTRQRQAWIFAQWNFRRCNMHVCVKGMPKALVNHAVRSMAWLLSWSVVVFHLLFLHSVVNSEMCLEYRWRRRQRQLNSSVGRGHKGTISARRSSSLFGFRRCCCHCRCCCYKGGECYMGRNETVAPPTDDKTDRACSNPVLTALPIFQQHSTTWPPRRSPFVAIKLAIQWHLGAVRPSSADR